MSEVQKIMIWVDDVMKLQLQIMGIQVTFWSLAMFAAVGFILAYFIRRVFK